VTISAPKLLEPSQGFKFKENEQPIKLLIENASSNGVRPLTYLFEVATDTGFATKVFARGGVAQGSEGRTSVQIDRLELGRSYYWRARADDGANTGIYSTAQFEVLPRPEIGAPGLVSPINNDRVPSLRPTLTVANAQRNTAVGSLHYDFQIALDQAFTQMIAAGISQEGGGQTQFTPQNDIMYDRSHYWRSRASDGILLGPWAATQSFRGPAAPTPSPSPSPSPGPSPQPPGNCASRNGAQIASCIAAKYPQYLAAGVSLGQRQANMGFLRDRMIEAGKCGGLDLGQNLKRGGPDLSIDFLVERRPQGDMGIDIAVDYDNTSEPLRLGWSEAGYGATYKSFPMGSCQ
jgi:hypothetical protein